MVIVQPDLGSGLVYIVIGLSVLFVAGASWRHFAALFVLFAVALTFTLVVAPKVVKFRKQFADRVKGEAA